MPTSRAEAGKGPAGPAQAGLFPVRTLWHLRYDHGFTKADAIYAAFHADVDWGQEAVEVAASWLENGVELTESELLERLKSGGFTAVDAQYTVDKVRR